MVAFELFCEFLFWSQKSGTVGSNFGFARKKSTENVKQVYQQLAFIFSSNTVSMMTPEERTEYLVRFLNLPVRDLAPTGLCKSDVYLSVRDMAFNMKPRPVLANIINPYARYCFDPIPVEIEEGKAGNFSAKKVFPTITGAMYKNFVNLTAENKSIAFRPSIIMVDDPVLASYLAEEIPSNSGTEIKLVNVKDTTLTNIDGIECNLEEAANSVWGILKKEVQKLVTGESLNPVVQRENDKIFPIVLRACQNSACGKLDISHKLCRNCMHATYCSAECQKCDWKRHKKLCSKK